MSGQAADVENIAAELQAALEAGMKAKMGETK